MRYFYIERHRYAHGFSCRVYWRPGKYQLRRCLFDLSRFDKLTNLSVLGVRILRGMDKVTRPRHVRTGKFID